MANSRNWVTATIKQKFDLNKSGVEIVVWKKWKAQRRGTLSVTVGGVRWFPFKAKKRHDRITWAEFERKLTE